MVSKESKQMLYQLVDMLERNKNVAGTTRLQSLITESDIDSLDSYLANMRCKAERLNQEEKKMIGIILNKLDAERKAKKWWQFWKK